MGEHTSFNLKDKVLAVLKMNGHTYAQLAEHVGISEKELDRQFADNSLEVRTLELISKGLRIPLYSLFRDTPYEVNYDEELYTMWISGVKKGYNCVPG